MFLCFVFLAGLTIKYAVIAEDNSGLPKFDYSEQDSLFDYYSNAGDTLAGSANFGDKKVDYEPELLDFSENDLSSKKGKVGLSDGDVVNINTADSQALSRLPGIGIKTAEKIIELRLEKKKFSSVEELLEVKGIGQKKLDNIKEFIVIE